MFGTDACLRVTRPGLVHRADVRAGAAERLLQQPEETPPLGVVERIAPRHLRREFPHQPLLRGDALLREDEVLHPPVTLAGLAPDETPPVPGVRDGRDERRVTPHVLRE